jgi:NADH-quinone oxidoreductase subunit M
MTNFPLLSTLIWLPILGSVVLLLIGNRSVMTVKWLAMIIAVVSLLLCIPLWCGFDTSNASYQFTEFASWIPSYNINYALGVDGLSMLMVALTTLTTFVILLASWNGKQQNTAQFFATFLLAQGMMIGVFAATDTILFYLFWEAMLIPVYLNLGMWGKEHRVAASIKYFIYTFTGSALMLIAILYLGHNAKSFEMSDLWTLKISHDLQDLIFIAFALAFIVKIPMWPFHTWLPDVHSESPSGGSVVAAALMLKLGVYGFLRFNLPITPDVSSFLIWGMIVLSLIAIVYIGIIAIVQTDMKRLIAYSSIAHMGFAVLGMFMIYIIVANTGNVQDAYLSLEGAMMQMVSHSFSTGALFIGVALLSDRLNSSMIKDYSGLAHKLPLFAVLMMIFALSNVGLPGTSGFVGEFMIILSSFKANFWVTFIAASTLIIGASYTLWMYKRVFFGQVTSEKVQSMQALHKTEMASLIILAVLVLFFGVYPEPLLNIFHASVGNLLTQALAVKTI